MSELGLGSLLNSTFYTQGAIKTRGKGLKPVKLWFFLILVSTFIAAHFSFACLDKALKLVNQSKFLQQGQETRAS